MSDNFRVRIAKAEHVFSAGHFITFGGICERLHGHNYRVACESALRLMKTISQSTFCSRVKLLEITMWLDHYMLLPSDHPEIRVEDNSRELTVTFRERRWVFPSGDCRILPVANTTSELLAAYIGQRLLEVLAAAGNKITHIRVELDECDGQLGIWETDTERSLVISRSCQPQTLPKRHFFSRQCWRDSDISSGGTARQYRPAVPPPRLNASTRLPSCRHVRYSQSGRAADESP